MNEIISQKSIYVIYIKKGYSPLVCLKDFLGYEDLSITYIGSTRAPHQGLLIKCPKEMVEKIKEKDFEWMVEIKEYEDLKLQVIIE